MAENLMDIWRRQTMRKAFFLLLFSGGSFSANPQQIPAGNLFGDMIGNSARNKFTKETITTSFADVDTLQPLPITYGDTLKPIPIEYMPKADSLDKYILPPGFYSITVQSYCIRAGTYGPSMGDGYGFAVLKGPMKEVMLSALSNQRKRSGIHQQDVQTLLWAIIARARFNEMNQRLKVITLNLLNASEILKMNRSGIGLVPKPLLAQLSEKLPAPLFHILQAENQMRQLFYNANAVYQDFERWAVRPGMAPIDRPNIKRGRWGKHPCGYYIRFFPQSYNRTTVQVVVPEKDQWPSNACTAEGKFNGLSFTGILFDLLGGVAVPANTQSQRLLLSNTVAK